MPPAPTAEEIERGHLARKLYEEGVATPEIKQRTGLSSRQLYHGLDGGPPDKQRKRLPRIARRNGEPKVQAVRSSRSSRSALVNRLWRAAERHAAEIEKRLAAATIAEKDRERDARTLSVLARTVRELVAIDTKREEAEAARETPEDDELPRDLDTLRDALAARIEQLRAERRAGAAERADAS